MKKVNRLARGTCLFWLASLLLATEVGGVQWYEYYEKGVAEAQAGRCGEAVNYLREALRVEPAPRPRIRTYGSNFIVNYDPHVYLAQCYALLGDFQAAERHLRVSQAAGVTSPAEIERVAEILKRRVAETSAPKLTPTPPPLAPTPNLAPVWVSCFPEDCTVFLDGQRVGRAPLGPHPMTVGLHRLRVERAGFSAHEEDFVLEVEGARFRVTLQPLPTPTPLQEALPGVKGWQRTERTAPLKDAGQGAARSEARQQPTATPRPWMGPVATTPPTLGQQAPGKEGVRPESREKMGGATSASWLKVVGLLVFFVSLGVAGFALKVRKKTKGSQDTGSLQQTIRLGGERFAEKYALYGVVGSGGMGTTFQGVRISDNLPVAIKVPHEALLSDPESMQRFLREARLGAQLHHPRIVTIFETGVYKGKPYIVMELLEGETLKRRLRRVGQLPLVEALHIVRDVAEAIDYAHSKGVVHRDLKPENIMLLTSGTVKVMDFGLARVAQEPGLTRTSVFVGTPLYAAPELFQSSHAVDSRIDIYALGVVLFEMLAGKPPYCATTVMELLDMHTRAPFPRPSELTRPIPLEVYSLIERACAKKPEDRWPSAEAFLVKLQEILVNLPEMGNDPFPIS